ncbi:LysR family transcriptional regulator, regulator for metE and metH [Chitinophaga sp. CF118]|uniref:LysR family transcriptional regulator n=1 Tax=Chitinophaga sp. CF118 TaxID=1884367 RepID=UPI0008DFF869|nr:LysR family transcriptional regulator [Chitinophaga sp. CF118]SFF05999.1 LysR family transcriptional regulator, regulator for metE and metH [Chitinophaga sp. CF118]
MITLQHLQIINQVIAEGSVTKASEKLHLTQSALSHQIRDLEASLGLKLFHRMGKKMVLTEAGGKVLQRAETVLPLMESLQMELTHLKDGRHQTVRISTECYTCYNWLPAILHKFKQKYPGIKVEIIVQATQRPMQYLEEGKLDLAIVSKQVTGSPFRYDVLFDDELMVVTSPQHAFARRKKVKAADISEETLILYSFGNNDGPVPGGLLQPKQVMTLPLTEAIIEMVKANMGITVMANWAVKQYTRSKDLAVIPLDTSLRKRRWYACTHKNAEEPLKQLITLIREALKN